MPLPWSRCIIIRFTVELREVKVGGKNKEGISDSLDNNNNNHNNNNNKTSFRICVFTEILVCIRCNRGGSNVHPHQNAGRQGQARHESEGMREVCFKVE